MKRTAMLVVLLAGCVAEPREEAASLPLPNGVEADRSSCDRLAGYCETAAAVWNYWSDVRISCIHREDVDENGLINRLRLFGLEVKLDPEAVDDDFHAKVDLLPADQYLALHLSAKGWDCLVTEAGDVAVFPPERRAHYETPTIREADELGRTRRDLLGTKSDEDDAKNATALASTVVTLKLEPATLYDIVDCLQETLRLNIVIAPDVRSAGVPDDRQSVAWHERKLGAALEELLAPLDLAAWAESRQIVIGYRTRLEARKADALARDRRLLQTFQLLQSRVRVSGDLTLADACVAIASSLGKRFRIGPALWRDPSRVVLEERERSASEMVAEIDRRRPMAVILRGDVLWFVER